MKIVNTGAVTVKFTAQEIKWLASLADFPLHEDIQDERLEKFLVALCQLDETVSGHDYFGFVRRVGELI